MTKKDEHKPDAVQEYLRRIGPRALTDAEARELHLLRLKAGATRSIQQEEKRTAQGGGERVARVLP